MTNWEHKGIGISITSSGEFRAQLDGDVTLTTKTLAEMRQTIEKELKHVKKRKLSLKVVGIVKLRHRVDLKLGVATIVGVDRTRRQYMFSPVTDFDDDLGIFPDTPMNRIMIEQIIMTKEALRVLEERANEVEVKNVGGYGRLPTGEYESVLKNLEARYAKALTKSRK